MSVDDRRVNRRGTPPNRESSLRRAVGLRTQATSFRRDAALFGSAIEVTRTTRPHPIGTARAIRRAKASSKFPSDRIPDALPAQPARVVPVPHHPARIDHRPVPFQRGWIRIRRRNPDCRHRDRDSGQAGTAGAAPLVVLLPVPVLDRLRGGPAVFRQPEERGAAANRAGPGRRGDRSRHRDRRQRGLRVRRRACGRHPVGRDDAVGRARDRPERDRRAADCRGIEGDPRRARPARRRHHVWIRRPRPDSVPHAGSVHGCSAPT